MTEQADQQPDATGVEPGMSRRRLFTGAAGGFAVGALGAGAAAWGIQEHRLGESAHGSPTLDEAPDRDAVDLATSHPFYDEPHPAGIRTPPQRYCIFMTFDITPGVLRAGLQSLLARWSAASAQLMKGAPIGPVEPQRPDAVAVDTGEADGLNPAGLTVTIGLGPGVFDDRFDLAAKRPSLLTALPALPSDALAADSSGGDLSLQICADDPQVAYHAVRNLARMVRGQASTRWAVMGFGRASAGPGQQTPRNLLGFKDGTRNVRTDAEYGQFVWADEPGWFSGGTYQVVRKIRMNIETWDADRISDQQLIFGRSKAAGAPLSGTDEFDTPDFAAKGESGTPVIDPTSHIALAAHENNAGVKILRRSYNYTDGINEFGLLDAGLLFVAYMNDPGHFVRLQTRLGASDLLNEYIQHIGSGLFAVPPAPKRGRYVGQDLFT